ncbi:MAG: hypothetical protein WC375_07630 [Methanomassiliicoccales archaeon]
MAEDPHKPLCFRGKGPRCASYMATVQHCESCKTCPLKPEGM